MMTRDEWDKLMPDKQWDEMVRLADKLADECRAADEWFNGFSFSLSDVFKEPLTEVEQQELKRFMGE